MLEIMASERLKVKYGGETLTFQLKTVLEQTLFASSG